MRIDILEQKENILKWINEEQPKSFIANQLNCKPETLNQYLKKMNIDYKGQQNKKGQQKETNKYKTAEYYFDNKQNIYSSELQQKLLRDNIKEYKCEKCGLSKWLNLDIPLELHHIDNNHYNNNLNNLILLCPNCHALEEQRIQAKEKQINNNLKKNYCIDCGKEINNKSIRCADCYHKSKKNIFKISLDEMPVTREELKTLIRTKTFVEIAKQFNKSDNTIRKWCDKFQLPRKTSDIKKISEKEWEKI